MSEPRETHVPRIGRVLDVVGLVLFLAGAAVFVRSWLGFEGVRHYEAQATDLPWAATRLANSFLRLQRMGGAIMVAGIAVFVAAWWVARQRTPAAGAPSSGEDRAAD